eukprot:9428315-Pyramimonas_sp.AAC.1
MAWPAVHRTQLRHPQSNVNSRHVVCFVRTSLGWWPLPPSHSSLFLSPRFIREELYSKEEAQKKWNESVADRRVSRVTENGILKLAVQGHTTFVHETGTE